MSPCRPVASHVLVLVIGLQAAAWAGQPPHAAPASALLAPATVLAVKGLRQSGNQCGPNSLAMVLSALHRSAPADLVSSLQHSKLDAALTVDMLLAARRAGLPATFSAGTIGALADLIEKSHPAVILVDLDSGKKAKNRWHYVVGFGVDRRAQAFSFHTGKKKHRVIKFDQLDRMWAPGGRWMLDPGEAVPGASAPRQ